MSSVNERILILNEKIQELKELRSKIVPDKIPIDFMESLNDVSKEKLKDHNTQISLLARERENLIWQLKDDDEKNAIRKDHLAITMKYSDSVGSIKVKYLKFYLQLLESLKPQIHKDKKLADIYLYLDANAFQDAIPTKFLDEMEKHDDLRKLASEIRNL